MNDFDTSSSQPTKTYSFPILAILIATTIAVTIVFSLLSTSKAPLGEASHIRIENGSNVDFANVIVNRKPYGDIARGQTTEYLEWEIAYSYSSVELSANGKRYKLQPEDFVGEKPLGAGYFSYVLSIDQNDNLNIEAKQDK